MDWNTVINSSRIEKQSALSEPLTNNFPGRKTKRERFVFSGFEEDYQNVLASSAFRAQQDKTQVFALDKSDFVRTRLTHSMEVSGIARELGSMVIKALSWNRNRGSVDKDISDIVDILATAGLLHDIGNPPFGHFGEEILSNWLERNLDTLIEKHSIVCTEKTRASLKRFEGNAQTFRILTNCCVGDMADIRPTYSTLGAIAKYTGSTSEPFGKDQPLEHHKIGFYESERTHFETIARSMGMQNVDGTSRHPLAFLLEAADDIAYRTADFEDALIKQLISTDDLEKLNEAPPADIAIEQFFESKTKDLFHHLTKTIRSSTDKEYAIHYWVRNTRLVLMNAAEYVFTERLEGIFEGTYHQELLSDDLCFHRATMKTFSHLMKEHVYQSQTILEKEIAAKTVLETILEALTSATLEHLYGGNPTANGKCFFLLPQITRTDLEIQRDTQSPVLFENAIRAIIDYVSGLTDSAAIRLHRTITGTQYF